jgi:hypothetical protein
MRGGGKEDAGRRCAETRCRQSRVASSSLLERSRRWCWESRWVAGRRRHLHQRRPGNTVRLVVPTPKGVTAVGGAAVSPDGGFVVFAGRTGNKSQQLYLQRLDEAAPKAD